MPKDRRPADLLDCVNCAPQFSPKTSRGLSVDETMRVAVGAQLVARSLDHPDQMRVTLGVVPEHEEGADNASLLQQTERQLQAGGEAVLVTVPGRKRHLVECLEPVFHIDREAVGHPLVHG
jgi:hypothetical protein